LLREVSAGGVVFSCDSAGDDRGSTWVGPRILMIKDRYGRWTFPKGQIEEGETPEVAALREVREETGVSGEIERSLGRVHYHYTLDERVISKTVHYFLVRSERVDLVPQLSEIVEARWFESREALGLNGYDNNATVLRGAVDVIDKMLKSGRG